MAFSPEQISALQAPLDRDNIKSRSQSGRSLSYVEGWLCIAEANRIFGFDAWTSETVDIRGVAEHPRKIGGGTDRNGNPRPQKDGFGVSYIARVRVTIGDVVREGVGAGHGIDVDLGLAHESAIKEAETDARKRALMTFGNPFGLALYDKEQRNVGEAEKPSRAPAVTSGRSADVVDLKDIASYTAKAKTTIANFATLAEITEWWRSEAPRRRELGIVDGTQALADLTKAGAKRKAAILAEVGGNMAAGQ